MYQAQCSVFLMHHLNTLRKSTRWLSYICCRCKTWNHGRKGVFLRSNINSRIWDSNPGMPDATLSSLFPVALRKVDLWGEPKGSGSWGFPILSWLNTMATLLLPLKNDKGVLSSHFYGLELADKLDNGVSFPSWYLYHCSLSSLEPWSFNNCSTVGVQEKVSIWRISEHA